MEQRWLESHNGKMMTCGSLDGVGHETLEPSELVEQRKLESGHIAQ